MNSLARAVLAFLPAAMLVFAPLLANHDKPRIFGFPFLLVWILLWVFATPLFLLASERLRVRE